MSIVCQRSHTDFNISNVFGRNGAKSVMNDHIALFKTADFIS